MAAKGQDSAQVAEAATGTVTRPNAFQLLIKKMGQMAVLDNTGPDITGTDIIPILEAETEADMWDADELSGYNAQKLSGCEIQIYGFEVKFAAADSEIKTPFIDPETGKQMYLLIEAARLNDTGDHKKEYNLPKVGELFMWNTSARNIVGKMFWMLEHGWFDSGKSPVQLYIKGTPLGGGRNVEKLKPLPGHVVNTTTEPPF